MNNCGVRTGSVFIIGCLFLLGLSSCIGDDEILDSIEPTIRILNPAQSIEVGTTYQFMVAFFNRVGLEESLTSVTWSSSNTEVLSIDNNGLATALIEGTTMVEVSTSQGGMVISDVINVAVSTETLISTNVRKGTIRSTSSYLLEGDFILTNENQKLTLKISENYSASTALPGLYVYLSNNPNSTAGAFEIGAVDVFNGAHEYELGSGIGLNDYDYVLYYCKPFNVKVGDGKIE